MGQRRANTMTEPMKHLIELVGGAHDGQREDDDPDDRTIVWRCTSGCTYRRTDQPDRLEPIPEARVARLVLVKEEA